MKHGYRTPAKFPSSYVDLDIFGRWVSLAGFPAHIHTLNVPELNDWVQGELNRVLRNIVRKVDHLENMVNKAAVAQRGYIQAFYKDKTNPVFRKEFQYTRVLNYVYDAIFDASGERYNWSEKFAEPPVLFPLMESYSVGENKFAHVVYLNGRPLHSSKYSIQGQAGTYSLFIDVDALKDFDTVAVEFHKFWNELGEYFDHINPTNSDHIEILVPISSVPGTIYNANISRVSDFIVYSKPAGSTQYTLVDPNRVTAEISGIYLRIMINKYYLANTEFRIMNNSIGWDIEYTRPMWFNTIRLVEDTVNEDGSMSPLPITDPCEVLVLAYDVTNGMSFKLVPYVDYYIENGPPYMLRLKRMVPPFTVVKIIKRHPFSWMLNRRYLKDAPTDGVILMDSFYSPISRELIDITLNNQDVAKGNVEQLTDFCFRIKEFESNQNLFAITSVMATDAVANLLENYEELKPSLEKYLEAEYDGSIFNRIASGEPDSNTPTASFLYAETITAHRFIHLAIGDTPPANAFYRENVMASQYKVEPEPIDFNLDAPTNNILQGSTRICFAPVVAFRNIYFSDNPPPGYPIPEIDSRDIIPITGIVPGTFVPSEFTNVQYSSEDGSLSKFFIFTVAAAVKIRVEMQSIDFTTRVRVRRNSPTGTVIGESTGESLVVDLVAGTYCIEGTHDHSLIS